MGGVHIEGDGFFPDDAARYTPTQEAHLEALLEGGLVFLVRGMQEEGEVLTYPDGRVSLIYRHQDKGIETGSTLETGLEIAGIVHRDKWWHRAQLVGCLATDLAEEDRLVLRHGESGVLRPPVRILMRLSGLFGEDQGTEVEF
jgi:hypothetical protein